MSKLRTDTAPSIHPSKHHRHGTRLLAGLTAIPLGLGLLAGCNTAEDAGRLAGQVLSNAATDEATLQQAERVRLANALAWKRGISANQALQRIRDNETDAQSLATYRKIEREHEQYLRRERLATHDSANGGGSGGGGGGHAH